MQSGMSLNAYNMYVADLSPQFLVVPDATGDAGGGVLLLASPPDGVVTADATGSSTTLAWNSTDKILSVKNSGSDANDWVDLVQLAS